MGRAEGASLSDEDVAAVLAGTSRYGDRTGSSMLYDRLAGQPLEHRYLTGEVVRRAERHGIPVPLNAAVLALLDALDRGRAESVPPAELGPDNTGRNGLPEGIGRTSLQGRGRRLPAGPRGPARG